MIKKEAGAQKKSISEWVRGVIREKIARREEVSGIHAVDQLRALSLPAPAIDQMLREIEEGRR